MATQQRYRFLDIVTDTIDGKIIKYERYLILSPESLAGQTFVLILDPD